MSSAPSSPGGPSREATAAHLRRVLHGFSPGFDAAQQSPSVYRVKVPLSRLSLPVFTRQVMIVFEATYLGRGDKVAWRYGFSVDGVPCVLESARSGLNLSIDAAVGDQDKADGMVQRVLDKLAAAQKVVIKGVISPQMPEQIQAGNVMITNQYAVLRGGYDYFREGAEQAYAGDGRRADQAPWIEVMTGRGSQEGWWNVLAMVSAYFSLFEHILIGCLPFTSFDPQTEDLARVIGGKWSDKLRYAADLGEPETARLFAALRDIAERFRNTYSHGAFGSGGRAAMFVRLPEIGEVPVTLGEFGVRPELWFVPATQDDFVYICEVFDSCDGWMANGLLAAGYHWVKAGLDFDFAPSFRAAASEARTQGRFEEFIECAEARYDALMNWEF